MTEQDPPTEDETEQPEWLQEMEADPYYHLRPPRPTPPDEICSCEGETPLLLFSSCEEILYPRPLHCGVCNGEVAPEIALPPDPELVNLVACYHRLGSCMDYLWFASGVYEEFARRELLDPDSQVNQWGLEAAREVSRHRPCYFVWFEDTSLDEIPPMTDCPVCGVPLTAPDVPDIRVNVCEACHVAVWREN